MIKRAFCHSLDKLFPNRLLSLFDQLSLTHSYYNTKKCKNDNKAITDHDFPAGQLGTRGTHPCELLQIPFFKWEPACFLQTNSGTKENQDYNLRIPHFKCFTIHS